MRKSLKNKGVSIVLSNLTNIVSEMESTSLR